MSATKDEGDVSFDAVATIYQLFEYLTFGGALARRRFAYLRVFDDAREALVLGDGDGRFTAAMLARNPGVAVTAVDSSAAMLAALERRVRAKTPDAKVETLCLDARRFEPATDGKMYDRVATHFFFDCFAPDDLDAIVRRIVPRLTEDARWVVSEFAVPTGVLGLVARVLIRSLYFSFRILTGLRVRRLPDHPAILVRHGLVCESVQVGLGGILRSEVWKRNVPMDKSASAGEPGRM